MWGRSRVQKVMKFSVFQPNNSWENWIFCQDNKLQKSKETNPSLRSPISQLCLSQSEPHQYLDIGNQSWIDQLETGNRKPRTQSWSKISWNTTGFSEKEKRTALRNLVKNVYLLGIFSKSNMWGRSRVSGGTKVSSFHQKVKLTENAFPDFLKTTDDPFLHHTPVPNIPYRLSVIPTKKHQTKTGNFANLTVFWETNSLVSGFLEILGELSL